MEDITSIARVKFSGARRMCDCWLIERAGTPIASTGGARSSNGITSSPSTSTVHGQRVPGRVCSGALTTSTAAKTARQTEA
jgi:hypothetical protein